MLFTLDTVYVITTQKKGARLGPYLYTYTLVVSRAF